MSFRKAPSLAIVSLICLRLASAADPGGQPQRGNQEASASQKSLLSEIQEYDKKLEDSDSASAERAKQLLKKLVALSDKELREPRIRPETGGHSGPGLELCLTEIIRRGGAHWEAVLKARNEPPKAVPKAGGDLRLFPDFTASNLGLMTALRRVQKKEDPLLVMVEGSGAISCKLGYPPTIRANLTNLDVDKSVINLMLGGDYRGSRANKWRVQITDSDGHVLPERVEYDMGGFMKSESLRYRESVPGSLSVGAYVQVDRPGTYTMVVLYHPAVRIGLVSAVDGLICCQSIPITLIVEPIKIETTKAEQARLAALILKLPRDGTVKILGGAYNEESSGAFMPKDSPAGQLKLADWNAVPELIAAVNQNKLNPTQRAWAIGLLFGITNQNDPTHAKGVIGPFEYRHSGWIAFGGTAAGLSVSQESRSVLGGDIDVKAQLNFAKVWKPWIEKGYVEVTTPH